MGAVVAAERVLYPGCYVDLAPSFVFPSVTYVDVDRRAAAFFADEEEVQAIIAEHDGAPPEPEVVFVSADYTEQLPVAEESVDLLVSLYAGFVSEFCTPALRVGGTLLVNPSHGDAAMASIDPRYRLSGVVLSSGGDHRVSDRGLDRYLEPKKPITITADLLHRTGRGVGYTRSASAYLFERVW